MDKLTVKDFLLSWERLAKEASQVSREHGFSDQYLPERIALMHSELSEALEAWRAGNPTSTKTPTHSQVAEELADCVIRIMSYSSFHDLNLGQAIVDKMIYNVTRPMKHGGKKI